MLKKGDVLQSKYSKQKYKIVDMIGKGGQGEVYKAKDSSGNLCAIKWYYDHISTDKLFSDIDHLVKKGVPEDLRNSFAWPLDILYLPNSNVTFGYEMKLIDLDKYVKLREVQADLSIAPTLKTIIKVMLNIVRSFSIIHLEGLYYRDISIENFMFNTESGDIVVFDNDNIGNNQVSKSHILGTRPYIAPEVMKYNKPTDELTDRYSMAIILFELLYWIHPFHGIKYYNSNIITEETTKELYLNPIFIFNEEDNSNKNKNTPVKIMWENTPTKLKNLFYKSFTDGINFQTRRVTPTEWQSVLNSIYDEIKTCDCGEETFTEEDKELCFICNIN